MKPRVLVVDDEPGIRKAIAHRLEAHGYEVLTADDGKQALNVYEAGRPDLIVLDLLLPEIDGFEICRRIREGSQVPIIILSIKGDELDRAVGFRLGVDDYMVKPFSPSELAMRIEAILRRTRGMKLERPRPSQIRIGCLIMDKASRVVRISDREAELTPKEFELLWALASSPEHVFTRKQLLDLIWGVNSREDQATVTALIGRVRQKVEVDPDNPKLIETVWGLGYKFNPDGVH